MGLMLNTGTKCLGVAFILKAMLKLDHLVAGLHVSKLRFFLPALFKPFFFLMLTSAEIAAFNLLKALFTA